MIVHYLLSFLKEHGFVGFENIGVLNLIRQDAYFESNTIYPTSYNLIFEENTFFRFEATFSDFINYYFPSKCESIIQLYREYNLKLTQEITQQEHTLMAPFGKFSYLNRSFSFVEDESFKGVFGFHNISQNILANKLSLVYEKQKLDQQAVIENKEDEILIPIPKKEKIKPVKEFDEIKEKKQRKNKKNDYYLSADEVKEVKNKFVKNYFDIASDNPIHLADKRVLGAGKKKILFYKSSKNFLTRTILITLLILIILTGIYLFFYYYLFFPDVLFAEP